MTYNLVARYIQKYGALPYGTEVPFITDKSPNFIHLSVGNFEKEVGEAFLRLYGVDIRHDIKVKGSAIVEIYNPNKKSKTPKSDSASVRPRTKSSSKSWGELSIFGKFFRLLKWIFYAFLLFLVFVGILIAYLAIKEAIGK